MARNFHRGPWRDQPVEAMDAALAEVGVDRFEYVECIYSDGGDLIGSSRLEPVGGDRSAIDIEVHYSEPRQQCQAHLRRVPCAPREVL